MASLAKGQRLIKNLTPAQVGRALAEWCAVNAGLDLDAMSGVRVDYYFDKGAKVFKAARVEVKVL